VITQLGSITRSRKARRSSSVMCSKSRFSNSAERRRPAKWDTQNLFPVSLAILSSGQLIHLWPTDGCHTQKTGEKRGFGTPSRVLAYQEDRCNVSHLSAFLSGYWPGGPGRLPAQGSHRSVRGHIRPYGSSSSPFASPRQMPRRTRHSLSVGVTVTPGGSSKPPKVFLANGVVTRCLASHPPGPCGSSSPASTVLPRHCDFLPAVPPHFVSFVWRYHGITHISLPSSLRAATAGLGLVTRYPLPGFLPWRRQDLPKFLGNPNSRLHMFSDPGRPRRS
jgi:hypothetical protein